MENAMMACRILLIDGNHDFTKLMVRLLICMGHQAGSCHDGHAGLLMAETWRPDVIFCDIGLPKLNGYEVARRIRQNKALKDIRLVALSGYAASRDVELSLLAGFHQHIAKPIPLGTLRKTLACMPCLHAARMAL